MTFAKLNSEAEEEQPQIFVTGFHRLHKNANFSFFQGIFKSTTAMPVGHTEPLRSNLSSLHLRPLSSELMRELRSEDVIIETDEFVAEKMAPFEDSTYFIHDDTTFLYILIVILLYALVLVFLMTKFLVNEFRKSSSPSRRRVFLHARTPVPTRGFNAASEDSVKPEVTRARVTSAFTPILAPSKKRFGDGVTSSCSASSKLSASSSNASDVTRSTSASSSSSGGFDVREEKKAVRKCFEGCKSPACEPRAMINADNSDDKRYDRSTDRRVDGKNEKHADIRADTLPPRVTLRSLLQPEVASNASSKAAASRASSALARAASPPYLITSLRPKRASGTSATTTMMLTTMTTTTPRRPEPRYLSGRDDSYVVSLMESPKTSPTKRLGAARAAAFKSEGRGPYDV